MSAATTEPEAVYDVVVVGSGGGALTGAALAAKAGTWVTADTVAGLAEAAGLPAETLVETVERFNRHAEAACDPDFRRGEDEYDTFFAGGGPVLVPCDQPPFHAARFVLSDLGTKGGLVTDPAGRVLKPDGHPIPGLYAAGGTAASVFGSVYPGPGAPLGSAMVFAALAVEDMASATHWAANWAAE